MNQQTLRRLAEQAKRLANNGGGDASCDAPNQAVTDGLASVVEEERVAGLIRAVDELLSATGETPSASRRRAWQVAAISRCGLAVQGGWRVPEAARVTVEKVMHGH